VLLETTTKSGIFAHLKEHLMAHLSILGTGNMGQAIAAVAGKGGHTVQLLGADDVATPVTGDIVVLAVPYPAIPEVIAQRGESLAGRIVVDITNPLDFETFDSLVVPADSSAAAEIAAALPRSRVLKAFNTTFAATIAAGTVGPLTTTVLIAGDDSDAKSTVAGVFSSGGLDVIDAGSLKRARELEAVGFLQLTLAVNEKVSWTGGFGIAA
jgi:predicted dinucleotide-binding enzyme